MARVGGPLGVVTCISRRAASAAQTSPDCALSRLPLPSPFLIAWEVASAHRCAGGSAKKGSVISAMKFAMPCACMYARVRAYLHVRAHTCAIVSRARGTRRWTPADVGLGVRERRAFVHRRGAVLCHEAVVRLCDTRP